MSGKNIGNPETRERDKACPDAAPQPVEDRQPAVSVVPYRPWEADELIDDLHCCADWHGVPVDEVVRHGVAEEVSFMREHKLGPWDEDEPDINFEIPDHLMRR